jgi:hypothetical protein
LSDAANVALHFRVIDDFHLFEDLSGCLAAELDVLFFREEVQTGPDRLAGPARRTGKRQQQQARDQRAPGVRAFSPVKCFQGGTTAERLDKPLVYPEHLEYGRRWNRVLQRQRRGGADVPDPHDVGPVYIE